MDFLFQLNDLVFFFIQKSSIIKYSFSFLDIVVNFPLQQSIDLVFQKEESSVESLSFVSSNDNAWAGSEEILFEFKEGSFKSGKGNWICASGDDDVFTWVAPGKVGTSLGWDIDSFSVEVSVAWLLLDGTGSGSSNVWHI